jgi:hypothetical protein
MSDSEDEHQRYDAEEEKELMEDFALDWFAPNDVLWFDALTEKEKKELRKLTADEMCEMLGRGC